MSKLTIKERFNRAVSLEREGDYQAALKEYQSVLNVDNTYRNAYVNMGALFARMGQSENSLQCYEYALKLDPDYLTFFNVGSVLYKMGRYKQAVISLERSKNLKKNFPLSSLVMGLCFSRLENLTAAETCFLDVLKVSPDNRVALTALAIMYFNYEQYDRALDLMARIKKFGWMNEGMANLKMNALYRSGKFDETASEIKNIKKITNGYKIYDEFIQKVPVDAFTDRYGTLEEKIANLKKNNETTESMMSLSLCHLFKGDTEEAIDCLFQARKLA